MSTKITPVLLLTGYLGSGKTTLLNHILNNRQGIRFAVIVNDIGEVNIDADLIARGGVVSGQDDSLVALQNGCICCSLAMDLVDQIEGILAQERFDYIVIEASGICEPEPIARTICSIPSMGEEYVAHGVPRLDAIVSVVDALRLRDEFGCGDTLGTNANPEDLGRLVIEQIEFCNIVLLNKASEVSADELARVRRVIERLNPSARIVECDYCDVPLNDLLDTGLFNYQRDSGAAGWIRGIETDMTAADEHRARHPHDHHLHEHAHDHEHEHEGHHEDCGHAHGHDSHDSHDSHHSQDSHAHDAEDHSHCDHEHGVCHCGHHHGHGHDHGAEYGIDTWIYYRRAPFDFWKFDEFAAHDWPANVIRCKGVVYFSNNRDMSVLFEQAGRQKNLAQAGQWYATAPEEDLMMLMQQDPRFMHDWDEVYGDRMIKLVFIGQHLDREALAAKLDACLAE